MSTAEGDTGRLEPRFTIFRSLTDENLNIIESKDIIMNPKSEWDWYVLENILEEPKEYYEIFPSFDENYKRKLIAKIPR